MPGILDLWQNLESTSEYSHGINDMKHEKFSDQISVKITPEEKRELQRRAILQNMDLGQFVRHELRLLNELEQILMPGMWAGSEPNA